MSDIFVLLTKFRFSQQIFVEISTIKFLENPSSRSRADTCEYTGGRTDMTEPIGAFRDLCESRLNRECCRNPTIFIHDSYNTVFEIHLKTHLRKKSFLPHFT